MSVFLSRPGLRRSLGAALLALGALGLLAPLVHANQASPPVASHIEAPSDAPCPPPHDEFGCPVCQSFRLPALTSGSPRVTFRESYLPRPETARALTPVWRSVGTIAARSPPYPLLSVA